MKTMIKKGSTRWVLLCGKYAFKIPSMHSYSGFLQGLLANKQEHYWWKATHHPRLAKVHYCDKLGLLLIMERAVVFVDDFVTMDECLNNPGNFTNYVFDLCEKDGLPVDRNPSNLGVCGKDNVWKLIDYGS